MGATSASGAVIAGGDYGSVALKVEGGTLFQYQAAYQFKQEQKVIELLLDLHNNQQNLMVTLQPFMDYQLSDKIGNLVTAKGFAHSNAMLAQNQLRNIQEVTEQKLLKKGNITSNQVDNGSDKEYGKHYDTADGTINATRTTFVEHLHKKRRTFSQETTVICSECVAYSIYTCLSLLNQLISIARSCSIINHSSSTQSTTLSRMSRCNLS